MAANSTSFGRKPKSSLVLPGAAVHVHVTGLPLIVPKDGLDQLLVKVRELMPDRSTASSFPLFLS